VVSSQSLLRVSSQKGQVRLHRDRLPFTEMLSDMELTIVHECFHFELAPLLRSEASAVAKNTQLTASRRGDRRSIARNDGRAFHTIGTQFREGARHSQSRQPCVAHAPQASATYLRSASRARCPLHGSERISRTVDGFQGGRSNACGESNPEFVAIALNGAWDCLAFHVEPNRS